LSNSAVTFLSTCLLSYRSQRKSTFFSAKYLLSLCWIYSTGQSE